MIITSLLDTDLYKFTMMQVVLHYFPTVQVEYHYKCRTPGVNLSPYLKEIHEEVQCLCQLSFTDKELTYLSNLPFIKSDLISFLKNFQLSKSCIFIELGKKPGEIFIRVKGTWLDTTLFEIPVLAIVNEVYFRNTNGGSNKEEGRNRLNSKIELVLSDPAAASFRFADYGTRRRFSQVWHEEILTTLKERMGKNLVGTSNVLLAKRLDISPLGTMGHEYLQSCQALSSQLRSSQVFAFKVWAKEYRGNLGVALSDTYGLDVFLYDFNRHFCELFDGIRHDSGDPFVWGERILRHYASNFVSPNKKTLIFSDSLTFPIAIRLLHRFLNRCQIIFGIGTQLTNDLGCRPLQIVMKMVRCNGQPVAKITDTPEKMVCDDVTYLNHLQKVMQPLSI